MTRAERAVGEQVEERVLASGLAFPEGPCVGPDGTLHVVDLAQRRVARIVDGEAVTLVEPGGSPNGAAFGPDGGLYVCNGGGNWPATPSTGGRPGLGGEAALIQRIEADGSVSTVVWEIDGQALNAPNDICFDQHGGFYFTDPVWPRRRSDGTVIPGSDAPGDVCYVDAAGEARRVHRGLMFPNGLQVTRDGGALLVAETVTSKIHRFPILAPGRLGPGTLYVALGDGGNPDGMCLDRDGRLLVASSGSARIFVVAPAGGRIEREVLLSDPEITNLCFADERLETLCVTQATRGRVVAITWPVAGAPPHGAPWHVAARGGGRL